MRSMIVALCAALLVGCGGYLALQNKSGQVSRGMKTQDVMQIMGPPQDRQFRDDYEAWQYCAADYRHGYYFDVLIWVKSGTVTGLETHRGRPLIEGCLFSTVRWEEMPDVTVEIRRR